MNAVSVRIPKNIDLSSIDISLKERIYLSNLVIRRKDDKGEKGPTLSHGDNNERGRLIEGKVRTNCRKREIEGERESEGEMKN